MTNKEKIEERIKEKFYIDIVNKYRICDTDEVYRKTVDEQMIHDFYLLWNELNKRIEEEAKKEIEKDAKVI